MANNNFEANMRRLEEIVNILESGECSLEDSMKLFEEGIGISSICNEKLKEAKQKIITLSQKENGDENDG